MTSARVHHLLKGVTVAGALPGPLQGYMVYEAAVLGQHG